MWLRVAKWLMVDVLRVQLKFEAATAADGETYVGCEVKYSSVYWASL